MKTESLPLDLNIGLCYRQPQNQAHKWVTLKLQPESLWNALCMGLGTGFEGRASCVLGKQSVTELYSFLLFMLFS